MCWCIRLDLKSKAFSEASHKPKAASRICVSVFGRTISDLLAKIESARRSRPGFIELRLDYLDNPTPAGIARLSKDLRGNEIFTFRSRQEGGVGNILEETRIELLRRVIIESAPPFIDLEIVTLRSNVEMVMEAKSAGSRLIASSHNFRFIESPQELRNLLIDSHRLYSPYAIKIVRGARHFSDNQILLSLYGMVDSLAPTKLITFCTGPLGILSRLSCIQSGIPLTYASFPGEKTALGQLEVETLQSLIKNW